MDLAAGLAKRYKDGELTMPTICVPCFDAGRGNIPAHRNVPVKNYGNVPMCTPCWGGGEGPGMEWKPKSRVTAAPPLVSRLPPAVPVASMAQAAPPKPKGRLTALADAAEENLAERKERTTKCKCSPECKEVATMGRDYFRGHKPKLQTGTAPASAPMDFDELLLDLEAKKAEIEKAIEAVKVVQNLYRKGAMNDD